MCKALIEWEREARKEEKEENNLNVIRNLMESLSIQAEIAMELMKIPVEDRGRYMELLGHN